MNKGLIDFTQITNCREKEVILYSGYSRLQKHKTTTTKVRKHYPGPRRSLLPNNLSTSLRRVDPLYYDTIKYVYTIEFTPVARVSRPLSGETR